LIKFPQTEYLASFFEEREKNENIATTMVHQKCVAVEHGGLQSHPEA
jgi:hypothetical protein